MKQLTHFLEGFGSAVQLLFQSARFVGTLPRQRARFIDQCYLIGYTTLPIVAILCFFMGSVLALQSGYSMENFGAKQFIGSLVGLSFARELGPVIVAILVAHTPYRALDPALFAGKVVLDAVGLLAS